MYRKSEGINKNFLELMNNYTWVTEYEVSIQKSITFLHTSNEQVEFEIKNPLSFTSAAKN